MLIYVAANMAKLPTDVLDFFRKQGKRGGKTAAEKMTEEERKARARKAGEASGKARRARKKRT